MTVLKNTLLNWRSLELQHVLAAQRRIRGIVWQTPLIPAPQLTQSVEALSIHLKLESLQYTGAFKLRGAANKIMGLTEAEKQRGVITFSTGNHGRAVAYAAREAGVKAVVCLSEHVPKNRVALVEQLGAVAEVMGKSQDEAETHYEHLIRERGYVAVPPFDDPAVIAGQGTVALEMLTEQPELDTLLVPLSGGGLLAGTALAAKAINPQIHIVGVSIDRSPAMLKSLKAEKPVAIEEQETLAGSLLGGIGRENHYTLPLIRKLVDQHVVVKEEAIAAGMRFALEHHSLVIEGAAAVGVAALQQGQVETAGRRIGIILSGSCVEPEQYLALMKENFKKI
ncbi:hydroxyectoine utilization dehydratase EutB [Anoxynatronum buryatiense]|uniref:hydroxyectoine utilization dehydratase EutB n=1 Tax=Anoxynatronum buryatiense TaxID=489973 RepID=UPI0024B7C46A|nr:hydroxyectoine utilization dehydratase EutB [Anoxynatronum buryatiense]